MNTLPTRPDGGINVDLLYVCVEEGVIYSYGQSSHMTLAEYTSHVQAHTRERCARDLQLEAKDYRRLAAINHPPLAGLNEQISIVLEKRASAIRGMED